MERADEGKAAWLLKFSKDMADLALHDREMFAAVAAQIAERLRLIREKLSR